MKKSIGSFFIAAAAVTALQTLASAEIVHGSIQKIDAAQNTLVIRRLDVDKNQNLPQDLQLQVVRDAKFKNIASLKDLHDGNQVKVDVKQNKDLGVWEAKSVELNNEAHV